METIRLAGDDKRLYFKNYERRSDEEEFCEVMHILAYNGCEFREKIMGPDCDLYPCRLNGYRFTVCDASIDGNGTCLCVDDNETMEFLEQLFCEDNANKSF